jgi:hypothetical protein
MPGSLDGWSAGCSREPSHLPESGETHSLPILEMLAKVKQGKDLTILAPKGRVVVIGSRGPVEINLREAMMRDAAILGMSL